KHRVNDKIFEFDTKEIKKIVGADIKEPEILRWIKEYIDEGIKNIDGGVWE
ncbi:MAG TPA: ATP-binding protein, partial [Clostridiaceae bacterium]|nr:ATP-binding protein [Clostridiaceae bacterium]